MGDRGGERGAAGGAPLRARAARVGRGRLCGAARAGRGGGRAGGRGGSGAAALAGTWLTRPGAAGWRENKAGVRAGEAGRSSSEATFFFLPPPPSRSLSPLSLAPHSPAFSVRGRRGARRETARGLRGEGSRAPPPLPRRHGECASAPPAARLSLLTLTTHAHTDTHIHARAHKGKEPYSRSPSRRRRRRRGRRAAAIPCAGPGGRGRSQPPFRAGLLPAPRPTKWGRRREPAAFRAHVAALSLGPSAEGGGGLPRAPRHPNFPRARFKKKTPKKKNAKQPLHPRGSERGVAAGVAFVPHPCLLGETSDRTCLVRAETHLGAKAIGNGGLSRPRPSAVSALPSKV
ncbi:translation initiation factor IF-2-like [Alexandromys fortis]|uniref:translation initiation factor IF-2-like n=1 Tax=Alexandromys fortis TaxID=100897 RepID=UPI0021536CEB|nr:translation initiation factor IF-2-like [Microtus fortis]